MLLYLSYFCMVNTDAPLTLPHLQEAVDRWIMHTGKGYFSELTNTAILMEEVGELARIMARMYGEQNYKPTEEKQDLGDEMADILWVLACLANQTGVDLEEAVRKNFDKKNTRDANRYPHHP
jgi:NTP pyrophosphatase (non-canonical NTP hydrolase)